MSLHAGARLGPYEIVAPLGAGGMGEVYKARDTRLDRTVAIKILPETLATDPQFRERFDREARALSQLTHPHICTLYDVGEQAGVAYLVMELLDGETLAARLERGALPLNEALTTAIQIASALDKAHRAGITHRDLKPGNIMLTKSGAKLLDFGLAKAGGPAHTGPAKAGHHVPNVDYVPEDRGVRLPLGGPQGRQPDLSAAPTMTSPLTAQGTILGTFQYMAPEQLEGQEADARTDIFAFGAVLYEILTGRKAFEGKTHASLIGAIMHGEPPRLSEVQPLTPTALDRIVGRCLAKNPEDRWQSARDLGFALAGTSDLAPSATMPVKQTSRAPWAVAALACALAVVFGVLAFRSRGASNTASAPDAVRLIVPAPNGETLPSGGANDASVAVSPDGRYLTFSTISGQTNRRRLWIRALSSVVVRPLEGTDEAAWPFWSPDSRFIGFVANGQLKTVEVTSGAVRTICEAGGALGGGAWNDRDEIVFSAGGLLFHVAAGGGAPVALTTLDAAHEETSHRWPQFLPDGRHLLFSVTSLQPELSGQYVGSLDSADRRRVIGAVANAAFANGLLLYRGEIPTLMAQRFDSATLKTQGEPFVLLDDLARPNIDDRHAHFSVSQNGVLAYQPVPLPGTRLVWFDRVGKELSVLRADGELYVDPEISPDGRHVAVDRIERKTGRIHVVLIDVSRGTMTRLNPELAADARPVWSKDGTSLAFSGESGGQWGLYRKPLDAAAPSKIVTRFTSPLTYPTDWSTDGETVLLMGLSRPSGIFAQKAREGSMVPVVDGGGQGRMSPDGRWLAYISSESGQREIYIRSMSGAEIKRMVSNGGGQSPRWRGDGRELFYANDRAIMAVDIKPGTSLELGRPRILFEHAAFMNAQPAPTPNGGDFAVSADGQRFLLDALDEKAPQSPITVVVNWTAGLKK